MLKELAPLLEKIPSMDIFFKENLHPNKKIYGSSVRFGQRISALDRRNEIESALKREGMLTELNEEALKMNDGVEALFVNRLPPEQAEELSIKMGIEMIKRELKVMGWRPDEVEYLAVGSSLAPLNKEKDGESYAEIYAKELGFTNPKLKLLDVNAACSSGPIAFFEALKQKGKKAIVLAQEAMLREASEFDPHQYDVGSALVFGQGMSVVGFTAGDGISLPNGYVFQEIPDINGYLAGVANYGDSVRVNPGFKITQNDGRYIRVKMPTPPPGSILWMNKKVGGMFPEGVVKIIKKLRNKTPKELWNTVNALVFHFPSKLIVEHLIKKKLLKLGLLPKNVLGGYTKEELLSMLEEIPLDQLNIPLYPKQNIYGNAPAANMLMALVDNLDKLFGNVAVVGFGAGATYEAGIVNFHKKIVQ